MPSYEVISAKYLHEGLVLTDDIYNSRGNIKLLSRGTILTKNLINRLKSDNSNINIRVNKELYKELITHGIPKQLTQQFLESSVGYTVVKDETKQMLTAIEAADSITPQQTEAATNLLLHQIKVTAPALIFQCINGDNPVDEYLSRHSTNVALINGMMGKWLDLPQSDIDTLVQLGLVHDIGKMKVDQDVLNTPGKLTAEQFEMIKSHTNFSYDLLIRENLFDKRVCYGALYHHEKINGSGYPNGLAADEIPYFARITSISDVYDAMVSKRVYKGAQSPFSVLWNLQQGGFTGLDTSLVNLFLSRMPYELIEKQVLLSDGSVGIVKHINMDNIEFPIVEVGDRIISTSPDFHCVSMVADNW